MRKNEVEIKINVKNKHSFNKNKLVQISYILMFLAFCFSAFCFSLSAHLPHFSTWYGGIVSCIFTAGFLLASFLIIRRSEENTFVSILFLSLIYVFTPLWQGLGYFIDYYTSIEKYYEISMPDFLLIIICLASIVLSIIGIIYYYRNNTKYASIFTLIACSLSILSCFFCSFSEIYRLLSQDYSYIPLVGISFCINGVLEIFPLVYLVHNL